MLNNIFPIRVLIVNEQELVRLGLRQVLKDVADIKIVGEIVGGEEILEFTKIFVPDVILMDIEIASTDKINAIKKIFDINPKAKILALTTCNKRICFTDFIQDRIAGYINKNVSARELLSAIRAVYCKKHGVNSGQSHLNSIKKQYFLFHNLSHRELQITTMIVKGYATNEISQYLNLSVKTINSYCHRVFKKLKIKSRVALVRLAMQCDLVRENV